MPRFTFLFASLLAVSTLFYQGSSIAEAQDGLPGVTGLAIIGDSTSDEYQTNDNRGGSFHAVTFNYVEILQRLRGIPVGPLGTWGEPRRTGYQFNWSRTGARTGSILSGGQVAGAAQQIEQGLVSHVFIFVGSNDFNGIGGSYELIYSGTMSDAELQAKIDDIVADMTTAVSTLVDAGAAGVVLATIGDPGNSPVVIEQFPDPAGRQRVTDAVNQVNDRYEQLALAQGIGLIRVKEFVDATSARIDAQGFLDVGGVAIDTINGDNDPRHLRLGDSAGHAGTVLMGLFANGVFIEGFNREYNLGLQPLSEAEIIAIAGLDGSGPTPTPTPTPTPNPDPDPDPDPDGTPDGENSARNWSLYE